MPYTYKVVPFRGQVKSGDAAGQVSKQLQELIDSNINDGWEMYQVTDVTIQVSPGCLGALFGQKETYIRYDQVIFRKIVE